MGTIDGHLIAHRRQDRQADLGQGRRQSGSSAIRSRWRRSSSRTRSSSARRRRIRHPRLHRRVRCRDRQRGLALQHDSRTGRAGHETWTGGEDCLEDRRRPGLGDRLVRSGAEPDVLGHRQSGSRLERRSAARRQPLHRFGASRSMPTPAQLKWHYQFTPHDEFDYDATQVPVLADIEWQGQPAQGDAVGEPERLLVRARSHHRRVPVRASRS